MPDPDKPKYLQFLQFFGCFVLVFSGAALFLWALYNYGPTVVWFLLTDLPRSIMSWVEVNPVLALVIGIVVASAALAWNTVYVPPKVDEKKKNDQPVKLADDGELAPEVAAESETKRSTA